MKYIVLILMFLSINAYAIVGATKGSADVSQGNFTYDVEIVTPKGIAGLKPSLTLSYNSSNNQNSILGMGFSLSGLSTIGKCNQTSFTDKADASRTFNYCLDGQKLVLVNASLEYGSEGTEYKTEVNNQSKIIKMENSWKVYSKDGLVHEYGNTADSNEDNIYFKVNKISDRYDNEINFLYALDNNHRYISQVSYADNSIDFIYEDRDDDNTLYKSGVAENIDKRLQKISIKTGSQELSSYGMTYAYINNFSKIKEITECAAGECLEPLVFDWSISTLKYKEVELLSNANPAYVEISYQDMNGDGLVDLVETQATSQSYLGSEGLIEQFHFNVSLNNGNGFDSSEPWFSDNGTEFKWNVTFKNMNDGVLPDINGDGLPDLIQAYLKLGSYTESSGEYKFYVRLNNGNGFDSAKSWSGNHTAPALTNSNIYAKDMNGDGLADLVINGTGINARFLDVRLNTGNDFGIVEHWFNDTSASNSNNSGDFSFKDINSDGLLDLLQIYVGEKGHKFRVRLNNGNGLSPVETWFSDSNADLASYSLYTQDINGDGMSDLVQSYQGGSGHRFDVRLNNGKGFETKKSWFSDTNSNLVNWKIYTLDVNGDGLVDLIQSYAEISDYFGDVSDGAYGFNIHLNNGNKFSLEKSLSGSHKGGTSYYVGYQSLVKDITGDDFPELMHIVSTFIGTKSYKIYSYKNISTNSKINSITNNKDQDIQVEYSKLKDPEIYVAASGSVYPEIDVKNSGISLVKSFTVADAVGGFNTTSFKYEGLKANRERGSLGFAKIETTNDALNTKTITSFHQDFPFIGMAKSSQSYLNDAKISEEINSVQVSRYFENQEILNLEITQNSEDKYNLGGSYLLTQISINSSFDKYGNIGSVQTTTKDYNAQYSKVTQSVYENDEEKWILSRLSNARVTHVHTDGSQMEKSSAFVYNDSTGTLEAEIIEPGNAKQIAKSYKYDAYGNKVSEIVSGGGIQARETKYLYDSEGKNLVRVTNALGHSENRVYDINNRLTKVTGPNGLSTSFTYDAMGKKIQEIRADGTQTTWSHSWDSSLANAMFKVTQKSTGSPEVISYFDKAGKKLRVSKGAFDGSRVYEDSYYDALGRLVKSSIPYFDIDTPAFIYSSYDDLGRIIERDRPGATGNRIKDSFSYSGLTIVSTNAKGQTKATLSNIMGQKTKVIEGDSSIDYKYDALGNLISTTDSAGNVISLSYDVFGNKVSMNDPDMGAWSYNYDALGQLISQTNAKAQTSTMAYDVLGRMVSRNEAEGQTIWTYDISGQGLGKLSYVQNDTYRKEFYYDALGRAEATKEFIDNNIFTTTYAYTSDGKLKSTTSPDGFVSINEYNAQGFLEAVKSPKSISNSTQSYDEVKASIEDSLRVSLDYAKEAVDYNAQAEVKEAEANLFLALANETNDAQDSSIQALNNVNYFLNLAQSFNDIEFYNYASTQFRDQTRVYIDMALVSLNSAIGSVDNLVGGSLEGAYLAQEKEMVEYHIEQAQMLLGSAEGLSQKVMNYRILYEEALATADTLGSTTYLDLLDDPDFSYYYKVLEADEFGRVTSEIIGNGLVTKKEYNKINGHLNFISTGYNGDIGDNNVRDIKYEFDDLDNVISKIDALQKITSTYSYDGLNRIASASFFGENFSSQIEYQYNAIGNIIDKSDLGSYDYVKAHQLASAGGHIYTYDANGNVIQKDDTSIEYSSFNKPVVIEDTNHRTAFFYAPSRARYKKTLDNDTTYYSGKLFEKETIKGVTRYKNFIYAGNELIGIKIDEDDGSLLIPSMRYMHKDALGSVDTITNELGVVVQRFTYKPFGERLEVNSGSLSAVNDINAITNRGFTGHEHITEFNLIHMNGRVYDPITGRFLSADPHIQAPYDTQSYNRYSYVKNNPLKYTDPSGFFFSGLKNAVSKAFNSVKGFVKKHAKLIAAVVITVAVIVAAPYATFILGDLWGAVVLGTVAGAANGAIMTGTLKGALTGAAFGAVSGAVAFGIGEMVGHSASFFNASSAGGFARATGKAVMHGLSRAAIISAQGGKSSSGFWSGFVSSGFSVGTKGYGDVAGRTAIMAAVGGTTSVISGGKFANGAVTGAFVHMFNAEWTAEDTQRQNASVRGLEKTTPHQTIYNMGDGEIDDPILRGIVHIGKYAMLAGKMTMNMAKSVISTISVRVSSYMAGGTYGAGYGAISYESGYDPLGALFTFKDELSFVGNKD